MMVDKGTLRWTPRGGAASHGIAAIERKEHKGKSICSLRLCTAIPPNLFQTDKIFLATKRHKNHKTNSFLSILSLFVARIRWSRLGCGSAALCSVRSFAAIEICALCASVFIRG
jgi:hypothetical protein